MLIGHLALKLKTAEPGRQASGTRQLTADLYRSDLKNSRSRSLFSRLAGDMRKAKSFRRLTTKLLGLDNENEDDDEYEAE